MSVLDPQIIATFLGPVIAVIISVVISIWYQGRKQKLEAKESLFKTLMAYRKADLLPFEAVNALNLIDVVFEDNRKVVGFWHDYYNLICQKDVNWEAARHLYLDLLSEMAQILGYKSLRQTDIDKFYSPKGHAHLFDLNLKIQVELLRVLENTEKFLLDKKAVEKIES